MEAPDYRALAEKLLLELKEAREDLADWSAYADEYFRKKHNLQGDFDRMEKQIQHAQQILDANE